MLTKTEKETIITFDEESDLATVYTLSQRVITQCRKKGYTEIKKDKVSITFQCPIRCISFRSAEKTTRKMTPAAIEALRKARGKLL